MTNIKVSIIIPVYQVERYILRCLQSVTVQKRLAEMELILVDDCGKDNSIKLAEDYLFQHPEVNYRILHHTHNRGLSAARNTGLKVAQGEYVYFLDSDDWLGEEDSISLLMKPLDEKLYDFIIGEYEVKGSLLPFPHLKLNKGAIVGNESIIISFVKNQWYMMAWNKLCNREFLLRNSLFFEEGLLHEDVVWSFKLACKADCMYVVDVPTYNYYIREQSIMTGISLEKDIEVYKNVFTHIADFIKEEERTKDRYVYSWFYGRLSSFLFSLLQIGQKESFNDIYMFCHNLVYLSPIKAYIEKLIGLKYVVRDMHYLMPVSLGRLYKWMCYQMGYGIKNKKIEGALWRG